MFKYLSIIMISVLLVGCGGAGSDSASQSSSTGQSSSALQPISASQTLSSAANLISSTSFTFSNQQQISLDLRLSTFAAERMMVNVCLPLPNEASFYDVNAASIDYQQCLYKTNITNGELVTTLTLAKHHDHLILELRPYANLTSSTTYHWQASDGLYWFIR